MGPGSHIHERRQLLVDYIERVLVSKQAPNDGDIFNKHIDRDGTQGAQDTQRELDHTKPVQWERLDHAEHVHVDVDGAYESADEVHERRTRDGTQAGQDDIGGGEGHGDPGVTGDTKQELVTKWNGFGMND